MLLASLFIWSISSLISLPPLFPGFDTLDESLDEKSDKFVNLQKDFFEVTKGLKTCGAQIEKIDKFVDDGKKSTKFFRELPMKNEAYRSNSSSLSFMSTKSSLQDKVMDGAKIREVSFVEEAQNNSDVFANANLKHLPNHRKSLFNSRDLTCQLSDEPRYVIYSALGSFYIPLVILVFAYLKVYTATKSRLRKRAKMGKKLLMNVKKQNCAKTIVNSKKKFSFEEKSCQKHCVLKKFDLKSEFEVDNKVCEKKNVITDLENLRFSQPWKVSQPNSINKIYFERTETDVLNAPRDRVTQLPPPPAFESTSLKIQNFSNFFQKKYSTKSNKIAISDVNDCLSDISYNVTITNATTTTATNTTTATTTNGTTATITNATTATPLPPLPPPPPLPPLPPPLLQQVKK